MNSKQLLVIVGAMKCGTTWLFHALSRHPEIASARWKEPDFFSKDEVYAQGSQWYESLWDDDDASWCLEASVSYTKRHLFPLTTKRMLDSAYDFRFLYVVRDPVERIESHLRHAVGEKWPASTSRPLAPHLVQTSRYAFQIEPYVERFGEESILVLDQSEMARDPMRVMRRVAEFLGTTSFQRLDDEARARRNVGAGRIRWNALGERMKSIMGTSIYEMSRRHVPESLKERILPILGRRIPPIRLSAQEVAELEETIGDETYAFARRYGVDASGWFRRRQVRD